MENRKLVEGKRINVDLCDMFDGKTPSEANSNLNKKNLRKRFLKNSKRNMNHETE